MKIDPSAALITQLQTIQNLESRLTPASQADHPPLDGATVARSFKSALDQVAASEAAASQAAANFEAGSETDIAKVIMARQTASLAFEATLQVRNKLLAAYKEIMSMPV